MSSILIVATRRRAFKCNTVRRHIGTTSSAWTSGVSGTSLREDDRILEMFRCTLIRSRALELERNLSPGSRRQRLNSRRTQKKHADSEWELMKGRKGKANVV